jgi:2-keto-4-pentenoate hydratase/2-oxohepta-3-ene-1,7-dioic acid hydratase in catechol pathway
MRIVVFGAEQRVGAWEGDTIVDLQRAFASYLRERGENAHQQSADARLPASLGAFVAAGPAALDDARRAIEHAARAGSELAPDGGQIVHRADDVQLHAPWPGRRIACAGGNYADHLLGMERHRRGPDVTIDQVAGYARDEGQWGFWKVPDEVAGPDDEVPYPKRTRYLDYEGEAAIILGKNGKDIPAGRIAEYVWGITLLNDWSIRDGMGTPKPLSYAQAKNFDRSTSMGPCIVVGELEAQDVDVETRVNDSVRQRYNTRDMIWSFGEILELLSRDFTFVAGDVISGGTAAGTAADKTPPGPDGSRSQELFLKVGDVVEVSSPKIGTLRNRIVQA